jgi:hypothetical protein
MDKFECEELTRIAYAMYNIPIMLAEEKHVFRSWFSMLSDIEYEVANEAFTDLAVYSNFMPRPGEVRRKAIDTITGGESHPDAATAWGILQTMRKATESGQFYQGERPEAMIEAMSLLGGSANDLHTNGDRETFVRVYNKVVEKLEQKKYKKTSYLTVVDEDA